MSWYYSECIDVNYGFAVGRRDLRTTLISQNLTNNTSYVKVEVLNGAYYQTSSGVRIYTTFGITGGINYYGTAQWLGGSGFVVDGGVTETSFVTYITVYHDAYGNGSAAYNCTAWTGGVSLSVDDSSFTIGNIYFTDYYPSTARVPTVGSIGLSTPTTTEVNVSSSVDWGGNNPISQRGFVYSTSPNPTIYSSKAVVAGTTGAMSTTLSGLTTNTTYYVRGFATNGVGTSYGTETSFATQGLASVSTSSSTNIALTSVTLNGSLTNAGNPIITQKGFVYATTTNPTTSDTKVIVSGTTTGAYSSNVTSLTADTTYYVRSYAINSIGTTYGSNISFKTLRQPSVTTAAVTNNNSTSATLNGELVDAGNPTITEKGFVYKTSSNPTTFDTKKIVSGTTTGVYTGNITGLSAGTTYYVRSYAINTTGTVYGSNVSFLTSKIGTISGTITFSGTIDPQVSAHRSISGTILFSGTVKAIKIFDPAFIDQKTYLYKIYGEDGTFLEIMDDVISEPMWSEEINEIGSSMTIKLARNSESTIQKSGAILDSDNAAILDNNGIAILGITGSLKKVGATSSLQLNNRVDIFAYYGTQEPILDSDGLPLIDNFSEEILSTIGSPNGTRKFTGFISEINIAYGENENTEIQLMSYGYDLEQYPLVNVDGDTTVTFNSTDPSDMIKTGITQFVTDGIGTYTSYVGSTITDTGTTASYTFRVNTYRELLDKAVQLSPAGWYYRIDLGSNLIYFNEKSATPQHYFYLGKHIKNLNIRSYISGVINDVIFTGGGDPALFRRKTITPETDTRRGLRRESDSRVTLDASADLLSTGIIDENKNIQYKTTVEIIDKSYDIESINVGDVVGFRNFNNEVDEVVMQIVRKTYTPDIAYLQLDTLPKSVPKRIEELRKALNTTENIYVPSSPTIV